MTSVAIYGIISRSIKVFERYLLANLTLSSSVKIMSDSVRMTQSTRSQKYCA